MAEGSVVRIVATLAGNTAISTNAPCRGVSAANTSCLSRVDFGDRHAQISLDRRSVRLVLLGLVTHMCRHGQTSLNKRLDPGMGRGVVSGSYR
jgi:hypothetical protein